MTVIIRKDKDRVELSDEEELHTNSDAAPKDDVSPLAGGLRWHDWRDFFSADEMEQAYRQVEKGVDPNDEERQNAASESDSDASEGGLNKEDLRDFMQSILVNAQENVCVQAD